MNDEMRMYVRLIAAAIEDVDKKDIAYVIARLILKLKPREFARFIREMNDFRGSLAEKGEETSE